MQASTLLPDPVALGLPEKFSGWRPNQDRAALRAVESPKRFVVLNVPTGGGKSLTYIAAGLLSGQRTCVLTSTKGLQNQIVRDFEQSGLVDIRGQNNYPCLYDTDIDNAAGTHQSEVPCDEGPCHAGLACKLQSSGCVYFDAQKVASRSDLVVTNYSYWMHQREYGNGLLKSLGKWPELGSDGPIEHFQDFGMLVLDEAHDALDALGDYLSVELYAHEVEGLLGGEFLDTSLDKWKEQAKTWLLKCQTRRATLSEHIRNNGHTRRMMSEIRTLKRLEQKLSRIASAEGEWVFEIQRRGPLGGRLVRFDPVWPADYAERTLFHGIQKVVLTSATVGRKTLSLLGVRPQEVDYVEYPSSFDPARRPVYWIPTVRMDKRATPEHVSAWISKIDAIIGQRLDRKGIIHAVSYSRAELIARRSEYSRYMYLHETRTAQDVVRAFKQAEAPAILVSPSVSTGFDFPMDECRYQIVCKIPFADSRNKVLAARQERDKDYGKYLAAQTLVQMCGRGNRSEDDLCENLILDDHFEWFYGNNKSLFPKWFQEAVKVSRTIPKPLEL